MSYFICLTIAVVLLILSLHSAIKSGGKMRFAKLFAYLLIATYIIYMPIFFSEYDIPTALIGGVVNTLQVISLDADYLATYEIISSAVKLRPLAYVYSALLGCLHFTLPAVSAVTAYTLIVYCTSNLRLAAIGRHKGSIYIYSEINSQTVFAARSLREHDKKSDIIFAHCNDVNSNSELKEELHCVFNAEPITDIIIPRNAGRQCFFLCFSESEDQNINEALALASKLESKSAEIQKLNHIFVSADGSETEVMIDSISKGLTDIKIIDENRLGVYELLHNYPLFQNVESDIISLLICGFTPVGEAFLKTALWCGQLDGYKLKIRVLCSEAEDRLADFQAGCPSLFTGSYDLKFLFYNNDLEFISHLGECGDVNYICICGMDDSRNIKQALMLRRHFYKADPYYRNKPFIAVHIESVEKHSMVRQLQTPESNPLRKVSYDLVPFGGVAGSYNYNSLHNSDIENLSRNVHLCYEEIFSDGPIDIPGALSSYNTLEVNKSSNRANAMHIRYKLWLLGLDYTTDESIPEVDLKDYLNEVTLERLTRAEHDRWMTFLETEGWIGSSIEDVERYKASGISGGRHNCPLLQMHPYICDYDSLISCSEALGLPDATIYDRELIARIPDILHDKWRVSGKRYRIIRLKNDGGKNNGREKEEQ